MKQTLHKSGDRLVPIMIVESLQEWTLAVSQGLAVVTTPEQRREWGLEPLQDVPTVPQQQVVEIALLAPDDPNIEEIANFDPYADSDLIPEEENNEVVMGPDGHYYKLDEEGTLVYDAEGNPVRDPRFDGTRRRTLPSGGDAE